MEKFKNMCRMSQKQLKKYAAKKLRKAYEEVVSGDGYVFAKGTFPVLLVAHLDTVHKQLPSSILYDAKNDTLSSLNGIGGDDRCGVYMILEVIKEYKCSVLFCEDEEIGCVGADKFIKTELAKSLVGKFNYIIEFDRKGKNDAVFYDCDNPEFEKFITGDFYKTAYGSYSDITVIAPALGCAAVNLSCGYYNAHTTKEYVVLSEMEMSIMKACKILERTTDANVFEYIEAKYPANSWYEDYGFTGSYFSGYYGKSYISSEEKCYIVEYEDQNGNYQMCEVEARSEYEAIGMFLCDYPDLTYNHIANIFYDNVKS